MQCIRPIKAGFDKSGLNIIYSNKNLSKELASFEFPCRKCLPCRLNIAREKAIRAVHEAQLHENNIFLTLTYNEENLQSPKLNYLDFQLFMKSLRERIERNITDKELKQKLKISYMVTGEYGDKNKRPHWHAILFNFRPEDAKYKYTTDLGEKVYESELINSLWKKGNTEFGSVTMDSASYVARYAAKKLAHGKDQEHDFHPIHKTSSKYAIGRGWIEKYCEHTLLNGFVILPNGQKSKIPRYYLDWAKKHNPELFIRYYSETLPKIQKLAEEKSRKEEMTFLSNILNYEGGANYPKTRNNVKLTILNQKFKQLQERLKL